MVPYKRTPPPLAMRLFFATMLFAMGPVFWLLQRFKLDGKLFAAMRAQQRQELLTKNPFKGYQPTEHDVFVVTYVKSGTNWMMQLAHQLLFHGKGDYEHIHCVVAWPDTDLMGPMRGYAIPLRDPRVWQASPEGKRVIKTHFRWEDVPYSPAAKYIIVIRDPKDVFVSSYHFFVKKGPLSFTGLSVAGWLEHFLSDQFFMGGSWGSTTAAYWAQRDKPNVLICSFKEMRRDLAGSVQRVASFLGVDASPEIVRRVTELSSFDYMKTHRRQVQHGQVPVARRARRDDAEGRRGERVGADHARAGPPHRRILHRGAEAARIRFPVRRVLPRVARRDGERDGAAGDGESLRRSGTCDYWARATVAAAALLAADAGAGAGAIRRGRLQAELRRVPRGQPAADADPRGAARADAGARGDRAQLVQHAAAGRLAVVGRAPRRRRVRHRAAVRVLPGAARRHSRRAPTAPPTSGARAAGRRELERLGRGLAQYPLPAGCRPPGSSASDVPKLKLKWAFGVPGVSASGSQVSVVGSRVFVGSRNGIVYSLDAKTGCLVWAFEASAAVRSTPLVVTANGAGGTVYFGDAHAQVYAVDARTGALKWKTKAEDHLDAIITGGVSYANGRVFVPVASMEEASGALPTYQCCTFRGSVLALDAASGKQIWKTYTIPEEPQQTTRSSRGVQLFGPSGAGVWGAPALDAARNRVYVATGDAYSQPAAPSTDAIMALAMDTGKIVWVRQTLAGDAWNDRVLRAEHGGRRELSGQGGTRPRLRRRHRARHRRRAPSRDCGSEVGRVVRGQRRQRRDGVEDARRRRRRPRRHRVGLCHRRHVGVRLALERVREEARRGGRPGEREPRRRQAALDGAAERRHLRRTRRLQHRAAGRGERDARRDLLRCARRPPARLRRGERQGDLGRRHRARLRHHRERRAGQGRRHERSRRHGGRRHGVRELGLRLDRLHGRQRHPRVQRGRQMNAR